MIASTPKAPLINRPLVGILAIIGIVGGAVTARQSFDNPWAGSLIRIGILLAMLWLFLEPAKEPVKKPAASPWFTIGLAGFGLLVIRSLKPGTIIVVIVFGIVMFLVRPRPKRS